MEEVQGPIGEPQVEPEHALDGRAPESRGVVTQLRGAGVDPRILAAWREWLSALATDAEAAIAAAHVYGELVADARDAWLDALAEDAPKLAVPAMAIYAPLLGVEEDDARRDRIWTAIVMDSASSDSGGPIRALRGIAPGGARVVALITPLYLSFVRVLWCRYLPDEGFAWVRHDPILGEKDAPVVGTVVDKVALEATPLKPVIEELAHAVLAQRRSGAELPAALHLFADLFDAHVEGETLPLTARAMRLLLPTLLLASSVAACVPVPPPVEPPPGVPATPVPRPADARGPVVQFSYPTLDGKQLTTQSLAGRVSVLAFVSTYDTASQAQARFLSGILQHHAPRVNVALLVLEPPENRPMVDAFASTLGIAYPVALADAATIAGQGPFPGLHHVPSVVILDREGRQALVHVGLMEQSDLDQALRSIEKADR